MQLRVMILLVGTLCAGTLLSTVVSAQDTVSPANYQVYTVINGDTITAVANQMKITEESILSFNQLIAGTALVPGDLLIIPGGPQYAAKPKPAVQPKAQNTVVYESGSATAAAGDSMSRYVAVIPPRVAVATKSLDELIPEIEKITASGVVSALVAICTNEKPLIYLESELKTVIWDQNTRGKAVSIFAKQGNAYAVMMADGSTAWMRKSDLRITSEKLSFTRVAPPHPQSDPVGVAALIETAKGYLGMPYVYGGNGVTNIDCSLFVKQVFAEHGVTLLRTAHEQAEQGTYVPVENLQPGDRLYFYQRGSSHIGHTGLYIGDGKFIHASSNVGAVAISNFNDRSYTSIYAWAKR